MVPAPKELTVRGEKMLSNQKNLGGSPLGRRGSEEAGEIRVVVFLWLSLYWASFPQSTR